MIGIFNWIEILPTTMMMKINATRWRQRKRQCTEIRLTIVSAMWRCLCFARAWNCWCKCVLSSGCSSKRSPALCIFAHGFWAGLHWSRGGGWIHACIRTSQPCTGLWSLPEHHSGRPNTNQYYWRPISITGDQSVLLENNQYYWTSLIYNLH